MLDTSRRTAFTDEHDLFRDQVRRFFDARAGPPSRPLGRGGDHRPRLLDQGAARPACSARPCPRNMAASASTSATTR